MMRDEKGRMHEPPTLREVLKAPPAKPGDTFDDPRERAIHPAGCGRAGSRLA